MPRKCNPGPSPHQMRQVSINLSFLQCWNSLSPSLGSRPILRDGSLNWGLIWGITSKSCPGERPAMWATCEFSLSAMGSTVAMAAPVLTHPTETTHMVGGNTGFRFLRERHLAGRQEQEEALQPSSITEEALLFPGMPRQAGACCSPASGVGASYAVAITWWLTVEGGMPANRALGHPGSPAPSSTELCRWREPIFPTTLNCLLWKGCCASGDSPWYEASELHSHTLVGKQLLGTLTQCKALGKRILQELCPAKAVAEAECVPYTQHPGFPEGKLMDAALLRVFQLAAEDSSRVSKSLQEGSAALGLLCWGCTAGYTPGIKSVETSRSF